MMHLGLSLSPFGHHPAAWRSQHAGPDALGVSRLAAQANKAQEGGLDFAFLADARTCRPLTELSPQTVPFEPTLLIAALATLARQIGFVASAATTQHELYNLARRYASLDLISRGRVGWDIVASGSPAAWNDEYVEVVKALWSSWDDDAFVYDKEAGRFFLPEKMHVLAHRGAFFTVRGPLNVNPSPQGRPIIFQEATTGALSMATRFADVMWLGGAWHEDGAPLIADLRRHLDATGRERSGIRILGNIIPYIGTTRTQAQDHFAELRRLLPAHGAAAPNGREVIGSAADIADAMQESLEERDLDGFIILPPLAVGDLAAFVDLVVPELRRRGLFRQQYEGTTLRDHLLLPPNPSPRQ
jgi:alkanesulfonate monooxygenase SsuD/methylene tetrahydromethanopterin reductase-like flavin-dependent oxidoreductase (luciferase family)